jgi:hypothetical protein
MKTSAQSIIAILIIVFPIFVNSQTRKISGTVLAFNKYPVKNATVKAKKAKTEAVTNENGVFEIDVQNNDLIRIKETVFFEYRQKITDEIESLEINLIFDNTGRNVDIASKAGYLTREDLEYGLEYLYLENAMYAQFNDAYDAIKYALPETIIIIENGRKGIQLRGPKTIHGSNAALIVLDGVIVEDVSFLNPVQIVSISKLSKPAASLYGARAGNGVISIETR